MAELQQQLAELTCQVRLMRQAQKTYFRTRSQTALATARRVELTVDALLKKLPDDTGPAQGSLF